MKGSRVGLGTADMEVKPRTLAETVDVLSACWQADVAILPQGANTSLTGGAVPRMDGDRPNVVINTRSLKKIMLVQEKGEQVLCQAGVGIQDLHEILQKTCNREPHSKLGSTFLNPSVGAGVSLGSGGMHLRKGPAFSNRALYLKVDSQGVSIVDTLGLRTKGWDTIHFLDASNDLKILKLSDLDPACCEAASWPNYALDVTKLDGNVSRFNADTRGLECNRSEGKVFIMATVHDTFPVPEEERLAWVSCKDLATAQALKREVALADSSSVPKILEYMNRDALQVVSEAGRPICHAIRILGMEKMHHLWKLKLWLESLPLPFAPIMLEKLLWWVNDFLPHPLPPELQELEKNFGHHVLMGIADFGGGERSKLESRLEQFVGERPQGSIQVVYSSPSDERGKAATICRAVVAPAFRTYAIGSGKRGLSTDYSLPKNCEEFPALPDDFGVVRQVIASHFGCNVFHHEFVLEESTDVLAAKRALKEKVEGVGGKMPAEHGHGTEYMAPPEVRERWMRSDPENIMNPGVGGTSAKRRYAA